MAYDMQIYTGTCAGQKLEYVRNLGLGIMISPSPSFAVRKEFGGVPCALDNGAFQYYRKGYPFQERLFLATIEDCYKHGIKLDFIVCPDIVAGGKQSLEFSLKWATTKLVGTPRLALVLQDGITQDNLTQYERDLFSHIFIGGTPEWKWRSLPGWASFCQSYKKHCHVGQCGTVERLRLCKQLGIDSVDSTNFSRNDAWSTIEAFQAPQTLYNQGYANANAACQDTHI
jgi:hypothetical protein